jgi:hypothetical protein
MPELNESNSFFSFLKMGNLFQDTPSPAELAKSKQAEEERLRQEKLAQISRDSIEEITKAALKEELDREVDKIIDTKNSEKLLIVLDRGYQINSKQAFYLMKQEKDFDFPIIKDAVLENYDSQLKNEVLDELKRIGNTTRQFNLGGYSINKLEIVAGRFDIIWNYLGREFALADDEYVVDFLDACKQVKLVLDRDEIKIPFTETINGFISHIETTRKEAILEQFEEDLDKYSLVLRNIDSIRKNMLVDVTQNIKNFRESDIPKDSRDIIHDIKKINREIDQEKLNPEQKAQLNIFYTKRFPQVLEEYITISPRYKEKLRQHNEDPDLLLKESLLEVKDKINEIFEAVQEKNHTQMRVTNRYLKTV